MMLDILADYLSWRGMKFCRLDGRMNLEERAVDVNSYNCIFALVFTYLNYLTHFDRWTLSDRMQTLPYS